VAPRVGEASQMPQSVWQNPEFELKTREIRSGVSKTDLFFSFLQSCVFKDFPIEMCLDHVQVTCEEQEIIRKH